MHQYLLGASWPEKQLCKKDLGALLDNKVNMSTLELNSALLQQNKASSSLGCSRKSVEVDHPSPLLSAAEVSSGVLCSVLGSPAQKRRGHAGESTMKVYEDD